MSFAFPSFLWALFVLLIPIIIHLFNFRKAKRIYFSNNRLLKEIKQETTQKRKLKKLLVLASRLLFLFFLVVAFAQPFLPAKKQITSGHEVLIYLDNSLSMSSKVAEKTRALDDGIARVKEIITVFPTESRFKLVTNDFAPFSNNYKSRSEIEDLLSQLRLSSIARTFEEVKNRFLTENLRQDIFWISDFQQSTLGKLPPLDTLSQWHLIPIQYEKSISNVYIDSVYQNNPFAISGETGMVTAKFKNNGEVKREDLVAKLIVNGSQSTTATFSCEPNGEAVISFGLPSGLKNFNEAKIVVNDFPISFDNEFFFSLNFNDKIKIVEIKSENALTSIEAVFGNKNLFQMKSLSSSNINYSLIKEADLVVINELNSLEASLQTTLKEYQATGGLIVLIPSLKPDISSYQVIAKARTLSLVKEDLEEIDKPDFQDPFFDNVFEEKTNELIMPKAKRMLDWGDDRTAILKFKDGKPFLSQVGNTILVASPLENDFTDFHNHALFVPIMYRIAASGSKEDRHLYFSLDDTFIVVKADSLPNEAQVKMIGSQEIIPSQRRNGNSVLLELPRHIINQGFYTILLNKDTIDLIGLNPSKKESLLKQYTGEEMKANLGGARNISLFGSGNSSSFSNEIKERYLGVILWKYALLLSLLFLLVEVLLIRFLK